MTIHSLTERSADVRIHVLSSIWYMHTTCDICKANSYTRQSSLGSTDNKR